MNKKRLIFSILTASLLGIICIIGITIRMGLVGNELFVLATWVNRVIIGLVIGLVVQDKDNIKQIIFSGAILGFIISGSLYLATSFKDTPGFLAGIVYGIIINYVATKYQDKNK